MAQTGTSLRFTILRCIQRRLPIRRNTVYDGREPETLLDTTARYQFAVRLRVHQDSGQSGLYTLMVGSSMHLLILTLCQLYQIAEGLRYLHSEDIIHGNLHSVRFLN